MLFLERNRAEFFLYTPGYFSARSGGGSKQEQPYNNSMTNERMQLMKDKVDALYSALNELSTFITEEDLSWALKTTDDMNEPVEFAVDAAELALQVLNVGNDLREMSYGLEGGYQ